MSNAVEICNIALSLVGAGKIDALTESSTEAKVCNRHFNFAVKSVLAAHDWGFARTNETLALVSGASVPDFDNVYRYPNDCLAARRIYNSADKHDRDKAQRIVFDVRLSSTGSFKYIVTDEDDAVLIYTKNISNPVVFPATFNEALAWNLAAKIVVPLKSKSELQLRYMQTYLSFIASVQADDSNQQHQTEDTTNPFIDARA